MSRAAGWRSEIAQALDEVWPTFVAGGLSWIQAQVEVESGGDPMAVSPAGAQGLLQLMPATGREVGLVHPFAPAENLRAGVRYLRRQYDALEHVTDRGAIRLQWALAAYNGGLGYALKALALSQADAARIDGVGGEWQFWSVGSYYLMHRDCYVGTLRKRYPDYVQIRNYVSRIAAAQVRIAAQSGGAQ